MEGIHTTMNTTSSHSHLRNDYCELDVFAATRYFSCEEDSKPPSIVKPEKDSYEAAERTEIALLKNNYTIKKKVMPKQTSSPRATLTCLLNSFKHCRSSKKKTIKPSKSSKGNKGDHDGVVIKRKGESKSCNVLSVPMCSTIGFVTPSTIQSRKKYYDEDDYWKIVDEKKSVKLVDYLDLELKEKFVVKEGCLDGHNYGWESDSSSDLFELNINNDSDDDDENGHVIYSNELPVYETTKMEVVKT